MIQASTLLYPAGRIHPDLFPNRVSELESDVSQWLTEAYLKPVVSVLATDEAQDAAATLWAYYRAFDSACIALAANPASAQENDQGASRYDKDQRETVCGLAAKALADFNDLTVLPAVVSAGSRTVRHSFVW